jgi:uncharacterized protein YjbI with pentapeptide repeats
MSIELQSGTYHADDADLSGSVFQNVNFSGARFDDVNLQGAVFSNIAFTSAAFSNVNLSHVTIGDANYDGMMIDGILVTELLRVYRERPDAM